MMFDDEKSDVKCSGVGWSMQLSVHLLLISGDLDYDTDDEIHDDDAKYDDNGDDDANFDDNEYYDADKNEETEH